MTWTESLDRFTHSPLGPGECAAIAQVEQLKRIADSLEKLVECGMPGAQERYQALCAGMTGCVSP